MPQPITLPASLGDTGLLSLCGRAPDPHDLIAYEEQALDEGGQAEPHPVPARRADWVPVEIWTVTRPEPGPLPNPPTPTGPV